MGQVVNVKTGFARQYLLPQKRRCGRPRRTRLFETQRAQLEATIQPQPRRRKNSRGKLGEGLRVVVIPPGRRNGKRPALRLGVRRETSPRRHRSRLHRRAPPGRDRPHDSDARPSHGARGPPPRGRRSSVSVNVGNRPREAESREKCVVDPAARGVRTRGRRAIAAAGGREQRQGRERS